MWGWSEIAGPVIGFWSKHVGRFSWQIRKVNSEMRWGGLFGRKPVTLYLREKPLNFEASSPYRKPTQVGRESILR